MKYSARALICAVLFCGAHPQLAMLNSETFKCSECQSVDVAVSTHHGEECGMKTFCLGCISNDICKMKVPKTHVQCLDCSTKKTFSQCEGSKVTHTFNECPANGNHQKFEEPPQIQAP
ncbi:hypothetical protein PGT21_012816 [Puccinia graminis f. sp. tritici]|uniref:TNFR-Cys domain-containing protein n=2 Tax=Puccinia graminis f. sp. tritici TaxID=56615 RepID=E3JUM7_PUCGT|nr:uncharacterized protein PGTG_01083 [Puccinia graminis f. sp. tritici CRL 75-36-700-3]EFP75752.1 hypothetical protein PGTG_01083 [Puccinia graminis f. sp. tritici CRL 75-36-700-3]KAA1067184.1 hypothetical protein PGTUg99_025153 [Puccinia graminis f. sp. tritici]KAA1071583.1 hypothetical protein PGT21_012232 [Puccinia graminis f. sp. tritici]KAA1077594.1 hypothetical protein PGT21_012816 [Puccinia graminis f. sp. tritici]